MWDAGDDDDDGDGRGEFWTERLRVEALGVKVATKSCPGREFFFATATPGIVVVALYPRCGEMRADFACRSAVVVGVPRGILFDYGMLRYVSTVPGYRICNTATM